MKMIEINKHSAKLKILDNKMQNLPFSRVEIEKRIDLDIVLKWFIFIERIGIT